MKKAKAKRAAPQRRAPAKSSRPAAAEPPPPARPKIGVVTGLRAGAEAEPWRINLIEAVERGVRLAGAEPVRLALSGVPAADGGSVVLRNLWADETECLALAAGVDGAALVAEGNDLLGAARLNRPAVFVPALGAGGGPAEAGGDADDYSGRSVGLLAEVMGLTLPYAATAGTGSVEQLALAEAAGRRVVELVAQNFSVRRVLMTNAFLNAARADAACGGSAGGALFLLALAHDAGVKLTLEAFAEAGRSTPQVCRLQGPGGHRLGQLHAAGGVPALLSALKGQWLPHSTVSGRGVNELAKLGRVKDAKVIRARGPYREEGGLIVLRGNLAPQGAFFHPPAEASGKPIVFSGPARVFDSREAALAAVQAKRIAKGDVLVVRYEGPRGGPGLRSLAAVRELLASQGLAGAVALFTDGSWGGADGAGLAVEMAAPEAVEPSTLSVVRDGDRVTIDVPARRVNVHLTDTDTKVRLARWQPPAARARNGFLGRYARGVTTVAEGAVLK
jgi:dihydroxy-acid dehydratase